MGKRKDILDRKNDILKWIAEKRSKAFMCRELSCKYTTLDSYLEKMGIKYRGNKYLKGFRNPNSINIEDYLNNKRIISSYKLKSLLIKNNIKEWKCENCGLTEWLNTKIPLELHHIDGNSFNNKLDNLLLLCPNCHALTENYRGRAKKETQVEHSNKKNTSKKEKKSKENIKNHCVDCGKEIDKKSKRCKSCSAKYKFKDNYIPERNYLKSLIRTVPMIKVGKLFGVTDNAVRKWCKRLGLPHKSSDIKKYSDDEWLLI